MCRYLHKEQCKFSNGAVAMHIRIADPGWPLAVISGVCAWIGLYLRLRELGTAAPVVNLPLH